jgi:AraC family transcriptional regulator
MSTTERTSPEAFDRHVPGTLIATSGGKPWKDLLVQIFARHSVQESIIIPAVPEPLIVWILSGSAVVEEREIGGNWIANVVTAGDFFLTTSPRPCELRWKASGPDPFHVMHLYLSLDVLQRAMREINGKNAGECSLREISGGRDEVLSAFLGLLRRELLSRQLPSALFVQGIAQGLAIHLIRTYGDAGPRLPAFRGGLPAFKMHRIATLLEENLAQEFNLSRLAKEAGLSESHFCRAFKKSTGFSPSQYFIRLRMEKARRLLRETSRTVIEIGMEVGYSSPSHFAQIFRREVGVTPREYRGHA